MDLGNYPIPGKSVGLQPFSKNYMRLLKFSTKIAQGIQSGKRILILQYDAGDHAFLNFLVLTKAATIR